MDISVPLPVLVLTSPLGSPAIPEKEELPAGLKTAWFLLDMRKQKSEVALLGCEPEAQDTDLSAAASSHFTDREARGLDWG